MSFHYNLNNGEQEFHCNLQCMRCEGLKRDGSQCTRTTCKHLPMCYQHIGELGLRVGTSNIPNAGLGLFATRNFGINELIAPYFGELLTYQQLERRYGYGDDGVAVYAANKSKNVRNQHKSLVIDAACRRSLASYINSKVTGVRGGRRGHPTNCRFVNSTPTTINVRATRNIRAGEEFILDYKANYFRAGPGVKPYTYSTLRRKTNSRERQ